MESSEHYCHIRRLTGRCREQRVFRCRLHVLLLLSAPNELLYLVVRYEHVFARCSWFSNSNLDRQGPSLTGPLYEIDVDSLDGRGFVSAQADHRGPAQFARIEDSEGHKGTRVVAVCSRGFRQSKNGHTVSSPISYSSSQRHQDSQRHPRNGHWGDS